MASRLVVITGGPGSGKPSVVDHLASLGYPTLPEGAFQIIDEMNRDYGIAGQVAWRQQHPAEFDRLVLARQVALEAACPIPEESIGYCDRGRPDVLAYAELAGRTSNRERPLRLGELLEPSYRSLGYKPDRVPERLVADRARLALRALGSLSR